MIMFHGAALVDSFLFLLHSKSGFVRKKFSRNPECSIAHICVSHILHQKNFSTGLNFETITMEEVGAKSQVRVLSLLMKLKKHKKF